MKRNAFDWGARIVFILLPIFCITISLGLGAYHIPFPDVARILWGLFSGGNQVADAMARGIVLDVRLPRILGAVMVGAGLSMSGAIFQGLFGNPLADPYTLGVSNGAGFGAALGIVSSLSSIGVQLTAIAFGITAVGLTFLLSARGRKASVTLILSGMLVSALFSSLISLIKFTADPLEKLPEIIFWLMGSLASVSYKKLFLILPLYLVSMGILRLFRWRVNVLSMGNREAKSFGVDVKRDRMTVILACSVLTALVVSISGIIGWVGIVIPHLSRMIVGPDFRKLLPVCASLGSCYLLIIDDLCRTLTAMEIPIGVITGIIGIPLFVYFIYKKKVNW